jgi:type I restriction enzyme S subunit
MTPDRLLALFDRVSEAPDAVPKLRRFVLNLAVRGKLVEQDPQDEPARLPNGLVKIAPQLPLGWQAASFGDVIDLQYGKSLLPAERLEAGRVSVFGSNGVVAFADVATSEAPAIIVGRKGSAGALNLCDGPSWTTDVAYYVVPAPWFEIRYLLSTLQSLDLGGLGKGVKPGLSRADVRPLVVLIPPVAEQRRIVARVDELMGLCDQLEGALSERERRRDRLAAATLARLNTPNPETFQADARFALEVLPNLTAQLSQIGRFRQVILNLAVRGKLLPQSADDEPAMALLRQIADEKAEQGHKSGSGRAHALPPADLSQAPFELPTGWAWARFPELGTFGRGKSKHRPRNDPALFVGGDHLLIQTGDVARSNGVIETYTGKYNHVGLLQSFKWPKGTLCITIAANIADSGILTFDACFPDSVVGFIPASVFENARYFEYFVRTAKANLLEFAPATAQKNINLEILNQVLIPLPPLAEQQRIVARVDELMALCDELEAALTTAHSVNARLLDAILHEALNGAPVAGPA